MNTCDHIGSLLEEGILARAQKHGITITINRLKGALRSILQMRKL